MCGTGTAVGARAADGRIWNASFWAEPSYRYSLSRGAIEAAARAEVGIDEPTLLQQLVPASTGHGSVEELLRAMTMLGARRPPLGLPAIALLDAADQGDATARRVLGEVADAIVEMARASARHAGLAAPTPIVLAGGLFRHHTDVLERALAERAPGVGDPDGALRARGGRAAARLRRGRERRPTSSGCADDDPARRAVRDPLLRRTGGLAVTRFGLLSTADINGAILAGAGASDRVEVVAVASRDAARAEAYAREHGIPTAHGSYDALLADPQVDAVYVSLPNSLHVEWAIRALEAGKHVLCEKPMSKDPAQVDAVFDAAEQQGLVCMEALMWRHHPQTLRLAALVARGSGRRAPARSAPRSAIRCTTSRTMCARAPSSPAGR